MQSPAVQRIFLLGIGALLMAGCASHPAFPSPAAPPAAEANAATLPAAAPVQAPTSATLSTVTPAVADIPLAAPRVLNTSFGGISATALLFDSRTHQLAIADQPGGPGSQWPDAAAAGGALGGIAAANAGFFTPEGQPLGLVVSLGKKAGAINRSSLGAGFLIAGSSPALIRRERWSNQSAEAVQAGPFLIENGAPVSGLSPASSTARTFIATDGGTRWALVRTGSCSLQGLAGALNGAHLDGMKLVTVLNLDGGRSSDLWISPSVAGGPVHERPLWNKSVRNFLVVRSR